jgi:ribosomal protein S19
MSPNLQFWIGLALAIPLSIAANLATPIFQRWLATKFSAYAEKRRIAQTKEVERVVEFLNNPQKLNTHLLLTLIVATMLGATIGVFTGLLFMLGNFSENNFATAAAQFITVFGGLLITKICLDAAKVIAKVREIEKFV